MWSNISSRPTGKSLQASANEEAETARGGGQVRTGGSPLMRYKHAVCSAPSGHIYVHGGRHGNVPLDDDVWRFDPHQNTWTQLDTLGAPDKPPSLQEHTLVEHQDQLYLFGGQVSAAPSENSLWRLDLLSNEWRGMGQESSRRAGAHLGPCNRRGHSAIVYQDSMYIYGGFVDFRGSSGQLWEFDLLQCRWELRNLSATAASHPEPRHSHSAIVYQDQMYVYGGLCNLKPLGDLWRWSWREKRWFRERTRGQSPGQLHGHSAVQAFGSMFVFGGERRGKPSRSLWRLNLANLTWQKVRPRGPRPSATTWHAAVANPLSILDETNYIIEGDQSSLILKQSSLSEHCCFSPPHQVQPVAEANVDAVSSKNKQLSHSKSSSSVLAQNGHHQNQKQLQLQQHPAGKRRLSFLRRSRRLSKLSTFGESNLKLSNHEQKQLKQSTSANVLLPAQAPPPRTYALSMDNQNNDKNETNTKILDNLDTDIKQMFERALPVNADDEDPPTRQSMVSSSSHYVTARHDQALIENQQRSSLAFTTPPSELATLNNSTCSDTRRALLAASTPAERAFGRRGDTRPKSEIVQSLIERADARIKHLYTPFFNAHPTTSSNHKPSNRNSLGERPKRHTIPQTSTYYNLYFSEEQPESASSACMKRDDLSSSTIRTIELATRRLAATQNSSGAVVGVHCGSPLAPSHTIMESRSQVSLESSESRTLCGQLDSPSVANQQQLRGSIVVNHPSNSQESAPGAALTVMRETPSAETSCDNTSLSFSIIAEFEEDDMLQYSSPTEPVLLPEVPNSYANNTKQEEEDDEEFMSIGRSYRRITHEFLVGPSRQPEPSEAPNESTQVKMEVVSGGQEEEDEKQLVTMAHKSASSGYDSISADSHRQTKCSEQNNHSAGGASEDTESSLGGFTSETSPEQSAAKYKRLRPRPFTSNNQQQQQLQQRQDHRAKTTSSSITADSLALTSTTGDPMDSPLAKSLPSSPPARNGMNEHQNGHNTLLTAVQPKQVLRSKFFGGRKQSKKTRYWQLCMFVIGGKQGGSSGLNEPITIWRLYI